MFSILQASIWQKLEQADQWLFVRLNSDPANPFFDSLMPFMRNSAHWYPLYLFLAVLVLLNFRGKGAWWMLFLIVTVALTDMTGTYVFKHGVERIRPCGDPDFFSQVRLLVNCSSGFSFTSNHAANHFGMAVFFYITFKPVIGRWAVIAIIWAALIAYAQVYVGIHYPFDILAGALLGLAYGTLTGRFFNKRYGFAIFDNKPTLSS